MAMFVSAYKRLIGGNKRESRQTLCLFPPILAYVVSRFRDLNYEKRKAKSEKRENLRLDYNPNVSGRSGKAEGSREPARED